MILDACSYLKQVLSLTAKATVVSEEKVLRDKICQLT